MRAALQAGDGSSLYRDWREGASLALFVCLLVFAGK